MLDRVKTFLTALVLALALLSGCSSSSEGVDTNCSLSACTVTFDRGNAGTASILGVEVKLVSADDTQATLEVAGQQAAVPVNGSTDVAGMQVSVQSITDQEVVVQVARQES
jgi:hypothetical protein